MPDRKPAGWIVGRLVGVLEAHVRGEVDWMADWDGEIHVDRKIADEQLAFARSLQNKHRFRLFTVYDETEEGAIDV